MKTQDTAGRARRARRPRPAGRRRSCARRTASRTSASRCGGSRTCTAICVMLPAEHLEPGVVAASSAPVTGLLDLGRYPARRRRRRARRSRPRCGARRFESVAAARHHALEVPQAAMNLGNAVEALCGTGRRRRRARRAARGAKARRCCAPRASTSRRSRRIASGAATSALDARRRRVRGGGSSWQSLRRGDRLARDRLPQRRDRAARRGCTACRRPGERVAAGGRERRAPRRAALADPRFAARPVGSSLRGAGC